MSKFKVGDEVVLKEGGGYYCDYVKYTIAHMIKNGFPSLNYTDQKYIKITASHYSDINKMQFYQLNHFKNWISESGLKLLKAGRPTKQPKINFLLKYDLDEDPIEEFETLTAVKKRIKEISKLDDLKRDSIVVYAVKSKKEIELVDSVTIKGL